MVDTVGIVGLGLIGGSLARRLTERGVRVVAWNHRPHPYAQAEADGIFCKSTLSELMDAEPDVVVLCNPLKAMPAILAALAPLMGDHPNTTLTDVGSVKGMVRDQVKAAGLGKCYVGAHPMAGNELSGWQAAFPHLYDGALWAITVDESTDYRRFLDVAAMITKDVGNRVIVVDDEMRTSDPHIWACGDCVQMKNRITGGAAYVPLGTTANKQGRIAGGNLAGAHETFKGVLGSMVTKAFELYISATGLSLAQAQAAGYNAAASVITKGDRASYYPGSQSNTICLILDKATGRLLGAQAIGSESVAGRINVFATAITCGMTVAEINELDLVYAPPVAPVYDPILIAASQAMKKVEG